MKEIEVVKILAEGSNKSFATFKIGDKYFCCFISKEFYKALKELGVPTAQKLRWEREKKEKELKEKEMR